MMPEMIEIFKKVTPAKPNPNFGGPAGGFALNGKGKTRIENIGKYIKWRRGTKGHYTKIFENHTM